MRCYRHHEREAVGTCKACGKGLCEDCTSDLGHGLACKGEHEELVKTYNMIIERNAALYTAAPKNIWIAPAFYAFMGALFAWFGYTSREGMASLTFILGAGFIVFALVLFVRNRQAFTTSCE